jgi:hypothetical protein
MNSTDILSKNNFKWYQNNVIRPYLISKRSNVTENKKSSKLGRRSIRSFNWSGVLNVSKFSDTDSEDSQRRDKLQKSLLHNPKMQPIVTQQILNSLALFEKEGKFLLWNSIEK